MKMTWNHLENKEPVNPARPLIYKWEIHNIDGSLVGRYVGQSKGGAKRPDTQYRRNVENLLDGKPYRKGKPDGYRRVHRALAKAVKCGHRITLQFLCNVEQDQDINEIELRCIQEQQSRGSEPWQLNE